MSTLPRRGLIELGVLTFFWGVNWPVMKIALSEMSPWTFRSITAPGANIFLVKASFWVPVH